MRAGFLKSRAQFTLLCAILVSIAIFVIVYGVSEPRRYSVSVGERSQWDISAPFDMIDSAQTERLARDAANAVQKVFVRDPDKAAAILAKAEDFIDMVSSERKVFVDAHAIGSAGASASDTQLLLDKSVSRLVDSALGFGVPISREEAESVIADISQAQVDAFMDDLLAKIRSSAELDITGDNLNNRVIALQRSIQSMYANQNLKNIASLFALSVLEVNVTEDRARTDDAQALIYSQNMERKIVIQKGTRIVSVDDYVTASQIALLAEYGLIETGEINVEHIIKLLFVLFGLAVLFHFYLSNVGMDLLDSNMQVVQLAVIITGVVLICRFLYPVHPLAMPIYLLPILISYLINSRVAIVIHLYLIAILSLFAGIGVQTLLFFIIGGALSAAMMMNAASRARFTFVAFALSVTCVFLFVALSNDIMNPANYYIDALILFATCMASSFLAMGLVALMESMFNTATPLRLSELSSGNTPLLRRLTLEAPGTHHHSLMVGHMAEAAAIEIGANPYITKTGAYYHDVGKLMAPDYFAENQSGHNPHDELAPEESYRIIVSHTAKGVELCEKNKLPRQVVSIVREHHGDTVIQYFYNRALKLRGAESASKDDYRYPGPRPTSREAAIVMLADSCEAAVRSSGRKEEADIAEWVRRIIRSKLSDSQLENCQISFQDLNRIEQSFVRVLTGFYHTRVKYPDDVRLRLETEQLQTQEQERREREREDVRGPDSAAWADAWADNGEKNGTGETEGGGDGGGANGLVGIAGNGAAGEGANSLVGIAGNNGTGGVGKAAAADE
jgi:putative nucleotidyltransferase with HDIG domain